MLIIKILTLASLVMIFIQDVNTRTVYWFAFPLLGLLLILPAALIKGHPGFAISAVSINFMFVAVQLFAVSLYFSFRNGKWTNITYELLGWGDILFLLTICIYMSVLNFIFFYVISLFLVLIIWNLMAGLPLKQKNEIPLAGLQAAIFGIFLIADWWLRIFHLTDDVWLLNLITR